MFRWLEIPINRKTIWTISTRRKQRMRCVTHVFRHTRYVLSAIMQKMTERKWQAGKAAVDTH